MTTLVPKNDGIECFNLNAYWNEQLESLLFQLGIDPGVDGYKDLGSDALGTVQYLLDSTCKKWGSAIRSVIAEARLRQLVTETEDKGVDEDAERILDMAVIFEGDDDPLTQKLGAELRSELIADGRVIQVPKSYEERLCDAGCEDGEPLDQKVAECYLEIADFLEKCGGCELW